VPPGEHAGTDGNRYGPDGYLCCKHCSEDTVHDVEKDGHDGPCQTCDDPGAMTRERLSEAEVELEHLRAVVTRVEALPAKWQRLLDTLIAPQRTPGTQNVRSFVKAATDDVAAALKGGA
jgi:hypothetical protein